jgi:hypothetical protein
LEEVVGSGGEGAHGGREGLRVRSDELDVVFDHAGGVREHGVLVEMIEVGGEAGGGGAGEDEVAGAGVAWPQDDDGGAVGVAELPFMLAAVVEIYTGRVITGMNDGEVRVERGVQ